MPPITLLMVGDHVLCRGYIKGRQQPARRQDTLKVENWVVQGYAVPLQLCPEQCNLQGSCLAGGPDAKNGFCACFKGFAGRECKEVMTGTRSNNCVNDCNGGCLAPSTSTMPEETSM